MLNATMPGIGTSLLQPRLSVVQARTLLRPSGVALNATVPNEPLGERGRTGRPTGPSDGPETCHQIQRPGDHEDLPDDGNRTVRMEGTLPADGAEQESL